MNQLDDTITLMVACVREGTISVGMLTASLLQQGMSAEEASILLDIIALEVKLTQPPAFAMARARRVCKPGSVSCD